MVLSLSSQRKGLLVWKSGYVRVHKLLSLEARKTLLANLRATSKKKAKGKSVD